MHTCISIDIHIEIEIYIYIYFFWEYYFLVYYGNIISESADCCRCSRLNNKQFHLSHSSEEEEEEEEEGQYFQSLITALCIIGAPGGRRGDGEEVKWVGGRVDGRGLFLIHLPV